MSASRRAISVSRLTFLNAVLMTTAFTVPAYAQIETVVVTAERRAEDIQTVPIAVTALTGSDLKARQVTNFRDLQFHVPSVTYTKSNFGGAQFQIRGITTQFGLGAAISQNINDIYLEAPGLVTGEYYDVARVEVSRGPQSTSYGRAATGGAVNVITEKADLNNFAARASIDYGEFNTIKPDAMVNVPIIDGELAVRLAVHADFHDGYDRNAYAGPQIYPGSPVRHSLNSLGIVFGRASVRWEPSPDTTIDFVADTSYENDRRVRGDKQQCHRDPSGVMGCLPDRLGFDAPNANSLFGTVIGSAQGLAAVINPSPAGGPFTVGYLTSLFLTNSMGLGKVAGNCGPGDPNAAGPLCAGGLILGTSIFGPQTPEAVNGPGSNPGGIVAPALNVSNTAYNPKYKTSGGVYLINWQQKIADWLSATVDAGYANGYQFTQQDYFDGTPENISPLITHAVTGFNVLIPNPQRAIYDSVLFNVPGSLPVSNTHYVHGRYDNYNGIIDYTRGGILMKSPFNSVYDEDWYSSREWTGEIRFQTAFDGPLNFSAGLFYMTFNGENQYWVAFTGGDWAATSIGAIVGSFPVSSGLPLMIQTPDYAGEFRKGFVQSRSAFLEATYDVLPDELRVIAGGRFNDDRAHYLRSTTGAELLGAGATVLGAPFFPSFTVQCPSTACMPGVWPVGKAPITTTDLWTGRVSVNWTPKLDWTQQTLVYLTASRGELAGGTNVINNTTVSAAPAVFKPATVDALELGTKNTLLDGTLQANLTAWYYNYENYQVGIIANRSALTLNIPAHLFGLEGEFVWQPTEDLAFNATLSLTQSEAGHAFIQDQRNPLTGPGGTPVPGAILVKDLTNGANCVIVPLAGGPRTIGQTPGDSTLYHVANFWLPNGGNSAIDAPFGVPLVNYGLCTGTTGFGVTPAPGSIRAQLQAAGFDYAPAVSQRTGGTIPNAGDLSVGGGILRDGTGFAKDLHGNNLPQVPFGQVGVGAQYTWKLDAGYTLVPRVDYYWQSSMQSRVWNDLNIDRMNSWDVLNMQIQLNAPDNKWYAQVFAKNLFDKHNPTGVYLTDATSALFTNVFAEDPRVIGFALGTTW